MLHQTPATKIPPSPKGAAGTTGLTRQVRYYPTRQLPRSLLIFRTRLGPNVLKLLEFLKKCFFDSTVQLGWETEVLKATGKMLLQPSFTVSENLDSFYKLWISDCSSFWIKPLNFWRLARVQIICWLSLRDSSNEERTCLHSYDLTQRKHVERPLPLHLEKTVIMSLRSSSYSSGNSQHHITFELSSYGYMYPPSLPFSAKRRWAQSTVQGLWVTALWYVLK